jgi:hypothetical protein
MIEWDADKILLLVAQRNDLEAVLRLLWSDWVGGMDGDNVFAAHGEKIVAALGEKP